MLWQCFPRGIQSLSLKVLTVASLVIWPGIVAAEISEADKQDAQRLTDEAAQSMAEGQSLQARKDVVGSKRAFEQAVKLYSRALALNGDDLDAALALVKVGAALKDCGPIVPTLSEVHTKHSGQIEITYFLGACLQKEGKTELSLPLLREVAAAKDARFYLAHYFLILDALYRDAGREALTLVDEYWAMYPDKSPRSEAVMRELKGRGFLIVKDPQKARAEFEVANRLRPKFLPIELGLVSCLEMQIKFAESTTQLERLDALFPNNPEVKLRLSRNYLTVGKLLRAESLAQAALKIRSSPDAQLALGHVRMAQARFAEADEAYSQAVKMAPTQILPRLALADALGRQARFAEAVTALTPVANDKNPKVLLALGSISRRAGNFEAALKVHRQLLALNEADAEAHAELGADYFVASRWTDCISEYAEALRLQSKPTWQRWQVSAMLHRGSVRLKEGNVGGAEADFRQAWELSHEVTAGRTLASALLLQGHYSAAVALLMDVLAKPDATWKELYLLGYAYLGNGQGPEAQATFEGALKRTKDEAAAQRFRGGLALAHVLNGADDEAIRLLQTDERRTAEDRNAAGDGTTLALALAHRTLVCLKAGESSCAVRDSSSLQRLTVRSELQGLSELVRVLVDWQEGRRLSAPVALTGTERWIDDESLLLVRAYGEYRASRFQASRTLINEANRKQGARRAPDWKLLLEAVHVREGEAAYARDDMARAGRAFKSALALDPTDARLQNNVACTSFQQGNKAAAIHDWQQMTTLPEAQVNLGLAQQFSSKSAVQALQYYRQYVALGGRRPEVLEWIDRIQQVYGDPLHPSVSRAAEAHP